MRKLIVAFIVVLAVLFLTNASAGTAVAAGPSYHVVQPGQTLSWIAGRYGTTAWAIANANGVWNQNMIYAGQVLYIPAAGYNYYGHGYYHPYPYPYPYPHPTYNCYYWVRYGDTMIGIAARYGTNAWSLAHANGIYNLNWIYAGQRLLIPGCH